MHSDRARLALNSSGLPHDLSHAINRNADFLACRTSSQTETYRAHSVSLSNSHGAQHWGELHLT